MMYKKKNEKKKFDHLPKSGPVGIYSYGSKKGEEGGEEAGRVKG